MAKFKLTIEGDDKDELVTALNEAAVMLGGDAAEAPAEEEAAEEEAGEEEGDDDLVGGEDEDGDDMEALREKVKAGVIALSKKAGGSDKVLAAFAKVKAKKLAEVKDDKLATVAKLLKIKV